MKKKIIFLWIFLFITISPATITFAAVSLNTMISLNDGYSGITYSGQPFSQDIDVIIKPSGAPTLYYNVYCNNEIIPRVYDEKRGVYYYKKRISSSGVYIFTCSGVTEEYDFIIDKENPTILINYSPTYQTNSNVNISPSIIDLDSGIAVKKYATGIKDISYFNNYGIILPVDGFDVSSNGDWTIYAADKVGRKTIKTINISNIDKTAPIEPTLSSSIDNGEAKITINYPIDSKIKQYKIGTNGTWTNYTDTILLTSNNIIYAKCQDSAGNWSAESNIVINNTAITPVPTQMPNETPIIIGDIDKDVESTFPELKGIIPTWRDYSGIDSTTKKELQKFDTPEYFIFSPNNGNYYSVYGSTKFYETKVFGDFFLYQWKDPNDYKASLQDLDYFYLIENKQKKIGSNGWKLVDSNYSWNLKLGSVPINDQSTLNYSGDGKGNMLVTTGKYAGNMYSFRYLGYTFAGTPVSNPYFPADTPSTKKNWDCNFIVRSWEKSYETPSPYAPGGYVDNYELKTWFIDYLFEENVEYRNRALKEIYPQSLHDSVNQKINLNKYCEENLKLAEYWMERLMWTVDPIKGAGMLKGWHISGGTRYYRTIAVKSANKRNIKTVSLVIKDKNGNIVGESYRDEITNEITKNIYEKLKKDEQYSVLVKVKNVSGSKTMTKNNKISTILSSGDNIEDEGTPWKFGDVVSIDKMFTSIPSGGYANFAWKIKAELIKGEIQVGAIVPVSYYKYFDNYDLSDDSLSIIFGAEPSIPIEDEDMSIEEEDIILIDSSGKKVDEIIQGRSYTVQYKVGMPKGMESVGDINNKVNNPFTTILVNYEKGAKNINMGGFVANEVLRKSEKVTMTSSVFIDSPTLKVCAVIDPRHAALGYNSDPSNDKACKTWSQNLNFGVKDFKVSPNLIQRTDGENADLYPDLGFSFKISCESNVVSFYQIPVVIRKGSEIIEVKNVSIMPNAPFVQFNWTVPDVRVSYSGIEEFSIEVNPANVPKKVGTVIQENVSLREYLEVKAGVTNPYADNVANTSLTARVDKAEYKCNVINTENNWSQIYSVYEWRGHVDYYDEVTYDLPCKEWDYITMPFTGIKIPLGCKTYTKYTNKISYCVEDDPPIYNPAPKIDHSENYEISKVLFRSKTSIDKYDEEWIDILNTNKEALVKAGYGFEIKVETTYKTDRYSSAPYDSWSTTCSGKTVSPGYSVVSNVPSTISVQLPHANYILKKSSSSGNWDNIKTVFEIKESRKVFGEKESNQIFIGENTKNGLYPIKIVTETFEGNPDKPTPKPLCDEVIVQIKVMGGGLDDLKTHIIQ